jgi:hypothetical protein
MRTDHFGPAIAITGKNTNKSLSRFSVTLLALLATLSWVRPSAAKTYYVGTCKTGGYSNISEAISKVPADSTIKICPGTYVEDLFISKPLTLQGMLVGNSSQVLIQPASAAASENSIRFGAVYPEVFVSTGPINLSNISIGTTSCPSSSYLVGIFYSGGFGTINHVTTETSFCKDAEIGILLENGTSTVSTTTVENSNIFEAQEYGIYACSTPSRSVVNVKGNYFYNAGWGVAFDCNTAGTARGNFSELSEMVSWSPGSVFSGNNLSDGGVIVVADTAKIESNNFYGSPSGVSLDHAGARVTDNKFMYTQHHHRRRVQWRCERVQLSA